jgi:cysteinyl-tRNA synthetase
LICFDIPAPNVIKIPSMTLKVHNTFSGKKEDFQPISEGTVGMYVCGVTVYDHCHIGHARSALVFDIIARYLLSKGYDVTSVKNFTDIDDKIIRKSNEEGIPWTEVGQKYIQSFYDDMGALNVIRPTHEPRATEHIGEMIQLVEALLRKGHAYPVDGDVYFSVESYSRYGQLSKRSLEEMLAGARVEVDERKRNPLDFALWKESKPGEPFWVTPFGKGRPGWHLECSVMSTKYLGNPFDIHGGGRDLIFPHHENERAQTEAATGATFVNYWIHNGFVNIEKEKMSKSIGNILLIKDFLAHYHPEVLRLFFLSTHYRNPIDYSAKSIDDAHNALHRLYHTLGRVAGLLKGRTLPSAPYKDADALEKAFHDAMDDDFNTALALSQAFELITMINTMLDDKDESNHPFIVHASGLLTSMLGVLGFLRDDMETFHAQEKARHLARVGLTAEALENLIQERVLARQNKDFKRADEIRAILINNGITLLDSPKGTEWRIKNIVQ